MSCDLSTVLFPMGQINRGRGLRKSKSRNSLGGFYELGDRHNHCSNAHATCVEFENGTAKETSIDGHVWFRDNVCYINVRS